MHIRDGIAPSVVHGGPLRKARFSNCAASANKHFCHIERTARRAHSLSMSLVSIEMTMSGSGPNRTELSASRIRASEPLRIRGSGSPTQVSENCHG